MSKYIKLSNMTIPEFCKSKSGTMINILTAEGITNNNKVARHLSASLSRANRKYSLKTTRLLIDNVDSISIAYMVECKLID